MSDSFDVGPLTWVKDDINQSLDSVLESVEALNSNPNDTAGLRFSQTHLYQASGALDMVGLEGCKLFCSYLEKLAAKLEKKELDATPEVVEGFTKAIKTLKYYIQELLSGSADIPLRLYSVLEPIALAVGETVDESALFFPDTSGRVPKEVPSQQYDKQEYLKLMMQQRSQYQKSLLSWMQGKDESALDGMVEALARVTSAQHKTNVKTMWWVASAFAETLSLPGIADDVAAKKVCRKLDQELRQLINEEGKPNPVLLRDLLYFVAIADTDKKAVLGVKKAFELDAIIDMKATTYSYQKLSGDSELGLVEDLKRELEALREIWEEVSKQIDFKKINLNKDDALVELDNVLITKFSNMLSARQEETKTLSKVAVADLFAALSQASVVLRDDKSKATQLSLIEVATTLDLLKSALMHYQHLDANTIQDLISETERLQSIAIGNNQEGLKDRRVGGLDKGTVDAVVKDINTSLKVVEQALDTYFRNASDKATLSLAPTPLKQMAAIFDMLSLPTPMQVIIASHHYIQYFQKDDYKESQADFELVAESLSMIGLYANEMPSVRPESTSALENTLERLNAELALTGMKFEDEEIAVPNTVETIAQKEKELVKAEKVSETSGAAAVLDKAFDDELADIYLTEAEEVLAQIAQNLQTLRVNATEVESLVEIRRSYHTLKGSGRTVGLVGQAEVAGKVEIFLNGVLEKKANLNPTQISKLEEVTAAFAGWAAALRASNEVSVDQAYWLAQAESLSTEEQPPADGSAETTEAYVLISGKRKLSRQLYEIFLHESMQNISILEQDIAKLTEGTNSAPEKAARRAIHTLASNALSAGFKPMGSLCRSLESWLDANTEHWVPKHLDLYSNVTSAIAKMWQTVSELKTPRPARALIKLLDTATEKVSQDKEQAEETKVVLPEKQKAIKVAVVEEKLIVAPEEDKAGEEDNKAAEVELAANIDATSLDSGNEDKIKELNIELVALFAEEASEILPEIGTALRAWKSKPKAKQHSDNLQRSLHTLKGSARMAAQTSIGNIAHELEETILGLSKKSPSEDDFESMFAELDKMAGLLDKKEDVDLTHSQSVDSDDEDAQHLARAIDRKSQLLRMRAEVLDRLINEAGEVSIIRSRIDREMLGFKRSSNDLTENLVRLRGYLRELEIEAETQMQSRMNILQETDENFDPLEFDRFTRLQELTRMIAESVNDVGTIQTGFLDNLDRTEAALQQQNRMNRSLQQGLLGIRMLPFKQISERLQRIVRQTSRELKKSVDLVIKGETTELDRGVLDQISAPLEHLLRNSVAHGIEAKASRKSIGKPQKGTISLNIRTVNDEIHIVLSDDGAGVDLDKVKEKAISSNLLDADAAITEDALLSVIFEPGFSTSDSVSQIAGRGVGLDVVRNDISSLGGRIDMSSEDGKGATFNIYLPVTQSVAHVLLVRTGDDIYALPVTMVEQAQKIKRNDLLTAYADGKVEWGGVSYPFHHLAALLHHEEHYLEDAPYASVLLLRSGVHTVALHVDEVIGNQEVVMKEMGQQLARVPGMVGATITGDGLIVLIINPVQIVNREVLSIGSVGVKKIKTKVKKEIKKTKALVVDDSLTMRKVLGRLLEREGYEVIVAKDGMDAMELLQISTPDIILTDIEMPRMDGFGLSRNIRDDKRTAKTPLIMISSRTADKHQNLAKEIGVNAFFGKPVQDEELIEKMKVLLKKKK